MLKDKVQKGILGAIYAVIIIALVIFIGSTTGQVLYALENPIQPSVSTEPTYYIPNLDNTSPTTDSAPPYYPDILPNRYGVDHFEYDGNYLTCNAGESMLGIDVSSYQGNINWKKVKDAGVEFAIIRVAGRGYGTETGNLYEDEYAQINYEGAKAAGLKVGAYIFSQAITVAEALEEASYILERIAHWELDMPVVFDWECENESYRTYGLDPRVLTDCCLAFCRMVEESGYEAMIYFSADVHNKQFFIEELTNYGFWLAYYTDKMSYPYHFDMWQYTKTGSVPGITGYVDINLYLPY